MQIKFEDLITSIPIIYSNFAPVHHIEPYFGWRHLYTAETDPYSLFFEKVYSEFEYTNSCYDHLIHPQWDGIGCNALFLKILFVDYEKGFAIIELIGEWNDAIHNDIMTFKREVVDVLVDQGINKHLLLTENVLNFHADDDSYYEEWLGDVEDGWVAMIGVRNHVMDELDEYDLDYYLNYGDNLNAIEWRKYHPLKLFEKVDSYFQVLGIT